MARARCKLGDCRRFVDAGQLICTLCQEELVKKQRKSPSQGGGGGGGVDVVVGVASAVQAAAAVAQAVGLGVSSCMDDERPSRHALKFGVVLGSVLAAAPSSTGIPPLSFDKLRVDKAKQNKRPVSKKKAAKGRK